jgi:hypothetical protein
LFGPQFLPPLPLAVRVGRRVDAEKLAIGTNPFNQAVIFAALSDKERALDAMERSVAAGPFRIGRQLAWPEPALIRDDPRMMALRRRVGFPQHLLKEDTQVYKQFVENESFRRFVGDMVYQLTSQR